MFYLRNLVMSSPFRFPFQASHWPCQCKYNRTMMEHFNFMGARALPQVDECWGSGSSSISASLPSLRRQPRLLPVLSPPALVVLHHLPALRRPQPLLVLPALVLRLLPLHQAHQPRLLKALPSLALSCSALEPQLAAAALPRNWRSQRLRKPSHRMWCPSGSVWQPKMCRTKAVSERPCVPGGGAFFHFAPRLGASTLRVTYPSRSGCEAWDHFTIFC